MTSKPTSPSLNASSPISSQNFTLSSPNIKHESNTIASHVSMTVDRLIQQLEKYKESNDGIDETLWNQQRNWIQSNQKPLQPLSFNLQEELQYRLEKWKEIEKTEIAPLYRDIKALLTQIATQSNFFKFINDVLEQFLWQCMQRKWWIVASNVSKPKSIVTKLFLSHFIFLIKQGAMKVKPSMPVQQFYSMMEQVWNPFFLHFFKPVQPQQDVYYTIFNLDSEFKKLYKQAVIRYAVREISFRNQLFHHYFALYQSQATEQQYLFLDLFVLFANMFPKVLFEQLSQFITHSFHDSQPTTTESTTNASSEEIHFLSMEQQQECIAQLIFHIFQKQYSQQPFILSSDQTGAMPFVKFISTSLCQEILSLLTYATNVNILNSFMYCILLMYPLIFLYFYKLPSAQQQQTQLQWFDPMDAQEDVQQYKALVGKSKNSEEEEPRDLLFYMSAICSICIRLCQLCIQLHSNPQTSIAFTSSVEQVCKLCYYLFPHTFLSSVRQECQFNPQFYELISGFLKQVSFNCNLLLWSNEEKERQFYENRDHVQVIQKEVIQFIINKAMDIQFISKVKTNESKQSKLMNQQNIVAHQIEKIISLQNAIEFLPFEEAKEVLTIRNQLLFERAEKHLLNQKLHALQTVEQELQNKESALQILNQKWRESTLQVESLKEEVLLWKRSDKESKDRLLNWDIHIQTKHEQILQSYQKANQDNINLHEQLDGLQFELKKLRLKMEEKNSRIQELEIIKSDYERQVENLKKNETKMNSLQEEIFMYERNHLKLISILKQNRELMDAVQFRDEQLTNLNEKLDFQSEHFKQQQSVIHALNSTMEDVKKENVRLKEEVVHWQDNLKVQMKIFQEKIKVLNDKYEALQRLSTMQKPQESTTNEVMGMLAQMDLLQKI